MRYVLVLELHGDGPADELRIPSIAEPYALLDLGHADLIAAAFGEHRNDELGAGLVYPDVQLSDLDLAQSLERRPQMVLEGIGGDAEENIDQPDEGDTRPPWAEPY